ncbi:MAG: glycosyltransferase family 2 protein [Burkholderiaceae bacterium]
MVVERSPVNASQWLSLILATYGRSEELTTVLDSLVKQSEQGFEIIVVDQNPDDRLVPVLKAFASLNIRHLRQPTPNLSQARNRGLSEATGEWVAFPDDDCWYEPDCLSRVRSAMTAEPALDGIVARWVEVAPELEQAGYRLNRSDWRNFRGGDASSITLFLRRTAVAALDGFDPRIGVGQYFGAGEETDLVLRLLDRNSELAFLPDARVHHHFSDEAPKASRKAWQARRSRSRGVGAIYAKHRLSPKVIIRGLLAPLLNPWRGPRPLQELFFGFAASLGRLEGLLGWWFGRS